MRVTRGAGASQPPLSTVAGGPWEMGPSNLTGARAGGRWTPQDCLASPPPTDGGEREVPPGISGVCAGGTASRRGVTGVLDVEVCSRLCEAACLVLGRTGTLWGGPGCVGPREGGPRPLPSGFLLLEKPQPGSSPAP